MRIVSRRVDFVEIIDRIVARLQVCPIDEQDQRGIENRLSLFVGPCSLQIET